MDQKIISKYNKELYTPEAKKERFLRVAEKRVNRLLKEIRLLGNTSNTNLYLYTGEDLEKMFLIIDHKLDALKIKFKKKSKDETFKFKT